MPPTAHRRARSYSIFLFDYPAGVAGELGVLYISLDYFKQTGLWSFPPYFNMYYALMAIMASYAYGLPGQRTFCLRWLFLAKKSQKKIAPVDY